MGMTCGPSELTQAMHSCAAVTFFFFAMSARASTMAKLCFMDCRRRRRMVNSQKVHEYGKPYVFLEPGEVTTEITLCAVTQFALCGEHPRYLPGISSGRLICPVRNPRPRGLGEGKGNQLGCV